MEKLPNLHDLSEERKNVRNIINNPEESEIVKNTAEKVLEENKKEAIGSIEKHGGLSKAKEHYKKEKENSEKNAWINEQSIESEMGPIFKELSVLEEKHNELRDFQIQRLRASQSDPKARKSNER